MSLERKKEIAKLINEEVFEMFKDDPKEKTKKKDLNDKLKLIEKDTNENSIVHDIATTALLMNEMILKKDSAQLSKKEIQSSLNIIDAKDVKEKKKKK